MTLKTALLSALAFASLFQTVLGAEKNLIDKDLSQFENVYPYGSATVKEGVIELNSTGNFFLVTKESYKNFILKAEVKMPDVEEYHNSGILFRAQLRATPDGYQQAIGYQAEVDPSDRKWSGGLYDQGRREWLHPTHPKRSHPDHHFIRNVAPNWQKAQSEAYKALDWNAYRIEARGSNIKIYLNDVLTTHIVDTTDTQGRIGLQHHGSKALSDTGTTDNVVLFRNVTIQELN